MGGEVMTETTRHPRVPGAMLLKIAPLLFSDDVIAAVVEPAISDLQREVAEAGPRRVARLRARWRGYGAFWKLALVVPFRRWPVAAGHTRTDTFGDRVRRLAAGSALVGLVGVAGPVLGAWAAVVMAAAVIFALGIHSWYARHPSDVADPIDAPWRPPQINFSSTDVAANSGGLIFVIGSVLIVAIGLPSVVWFLVAATAGGILVAWALVRWRTSHPHAGLPENRIGVSLRS
jgi:hypothetical protein